MPEGFVQTNINLTEEDDRMLSRMMAEEGFENRSAFIRRMVRLEWIKRYGRPSVGEPHEINPATQPQPSRP